MSVNCDSELVDTTQSVAHLVSVLVAQPTSPPTIFIDLEGINLGRNGSISILQIYVSSINKAFLVDVHTLQHAAFNTPGASGTSTLKDVLESATIPKAVFDIRNDSDALFSHFFVRVAGIVDLQLMELATRPAGPRKRVVSGLARCILADAGLTSAEMVTWKAGKDAGLALFAPERGGSYEVFNQRPLAAAVRDYCVQDVHLLPRLWKTYDRKLSKPWQDRVQAATQARINQSQSVTYNGKGKHMALGPPGWTQIP